MGLSISCFCHQGFSWSEFTTWMNFCSRIFPILSPFEETTPWCLKKRRRRRRHQSHSPMPISQVHNHMRKSLNDTQEMKMTGQSVFPTSEHFSAQILRQPYFNGQQWCGAQSPATAEGQLGKGSYWQDSSSTALANLSLVTRPTQGMHPSPLLEQSRKSSESKRWS